MMLPIYLYPISFFLLFWFTKNKKNRIVYSTLLITYLFSTIAAVFISTNKFIYGGVSSSWYAAIYHIFFTIVIILQFRNYDSSYYKQLLTIKNGSSFRIFTGIVLFLCLISIFNNIQRVDFNLIMNDVHALRGIVNENKEISFIGYISFLAHQYTSVALALMFYYIIKKPHKKFLILLLAFCSLTSLISSLQVAGREYLLKYLFLFFIAYSFTKSQLPGNWKRNLKNYFFVVAGFSLTLFVIISFLRFRYSSYASGASESDNTIYSLLSYFGQGWIYFSDVFMTFQKPLTPPGAINFPFFASESISKNNLNDFINVEIYLNNFTTSLGSWVVDGGVVFGAIVAIIFSLILRFISKLKYNVFSLIYILWAFEFIFSYMFFFNDVFNTSRVASIVLVVFFDIIERRTVKVNA